MNETLTAGQVQEVAVDGGDPQVGRAGVKQHGEGLRGGADADLPVVLSLRTFKQHHTSSLFPADSVRNAKGVTDNGFGDNKVCQLTWYQLNTKAYLSECGCFTCVWKGRISWARGECRLRQQSSSQIQSSCKCALAWVDLLHYIRLLHYIYKTLLYMLTFLIISKVNQYQVLPTSMKLVSRSTGRVSEGRLSEVPVLLASACSSCTDIPLSAIRRRRLRVLWRGTLERERRVKQLLPPSTLACEQTACSRVDPAGSYFAQTCKNLVS